MLLCASPAFGQDVPTVPPGSDVYRRLEAVTAFFPVPVHLGLRPASQRALVSVLGHAMQAVLAAPESHPRRAWALGELQGIIADIWSAPAGAAAAWRLDGYASDAAVTRIEANGLGSIDATESSFGRDRKGLPYPRGGTIHAFATGLLQGSRYALLAEPQVGFVADPDGRRGHARVNRAYGRLVVKNLALQAGSDERRWGQSVHGPLFLSSNAAPVPALSIGTDTAITLPWLFRLAGPVTGTLFVGDLGPTQDPPHARLAGWQVNMQPWSRFELGVTVLVQTGGNGAPGATFLERVIDLFPAIDAIAPQHADLLFSNKIAGGNLRMRFPELSGLDFYYELAIDDFDGRRLVSSMVDDAAHLLGARVAAGNAVVRGEWHRTALRLYEHTQFRSGMTYRQRLLGSPLGPHARAGYLGVEWPVATGWSASLAAADERRDPSQYTATISGERDRGFRFIRLTDEPTIRRALVVGSLEGRLGAIGARMTYGAGRAWREGSAGSTDWLARLELRSQLLNWF